MKKHVYEMIKPPTEGEDPFAEGADAALAGASDTSNPYAPETDAHLSWNDGYWETRDTM